MNNKQQVITNIPKMYYVHVRLVWGMVLGLFLAATNVLAQQDQSAYEISSPVSGVIKKVYVIEGQSVKKGDLLLEFDDTLLASDLSEAQVNMSLAKLDQSEAKKEFIRAEELYERSVLSEHELQQARVLYSKAQAQYAVARNILTHARWNISHIKLYATFPGQVSQVYSYPGQYVNNQFTAQILFLIKKFLIKK